MKYIILLVLSFSFWNTSEILAQCNPPAALDCDASSVLCSLDELDGFSCSNPDIINRTGPTPLCGDGIPHNTNWWAFIADGSFMVLELVFDTTDCKGGAVCPIKGIQAGVLDDCDGNAMDCSAQCDNSTFSLSFQTLACHTYYVWIDGCCGDVCNYTINVDGGGPPSIPRPVPVPMLIGRACPCAIAQICVEEIPDCDVVKQWTVDGVDQPNFDNFECLDFEVRQDGAPVEVCVTYTIGNPANPNAICDQETACTIIIPEDVIEIFEPPIFVCFEEHEGGGYVWHDSLVLTSCINPPCRIRESPGFDECCIDYEAEITLIPARRVVEVYKFFCGIDDLPLVTEDGGVWSEEVCGEEITWSDPDFHDCDTTYLLYMTVFDPEVTIEQNCERCDGFSTVTAEVEFDFNCLGGDVTWIKYWMNSFFDTIFVGDELRTSDTGTIYLNLHVTYVDATTGEVVQCDLEGRPLWSIKLDNTILEDPVLSGTSPICIGATGKYKLENTYLDICEYSWYVKRGGGVITTPDYVDSTEIVVDWTNLMGTEGEICVSVLADCSKTKEECFIVDFKSAPTPDAGFDTVLCAQNYKLDGTIDVPGGKWTIVKAPGNINIDETDIDSDISVDAFGEYVLVWNESILTCEGNDTVRILFNSDPTFGPVDTICLTDAINYKIIFEILDGTGPYIIVEGGGTIGAGNIYTSDTIIDNSSHRIVIEDKYGCFFEFEINYDCECPNDIGLVSSDTIKSCGISEVEIDYNPTNMVLGPNDVFQYVLYGTLGNIIGTQLEKNHTGKFTFDPATMTYGQVYYMGVIVGEDDGTGFVNMQAGCVQIAEGQPVIWYEMPTPDAGLDFSVCSRKVNLSGISSIQGSTIKWQNTIGAIIDDPNNNNTLATITDFGTYVFKFVETNEICEGVDSITITFNESPDISGLIKECIDQNVTYEWIYKVQLGKGAKPYQLISGNGNLDLATGIFTSNRLKSLDADEIIIEDANGCRDTLVVRHNCDCGLTKPGTMDTELEELCVDKCITVVANNDHGTEVDDCVFMILQPDSSSVDPNKLIDIQDYDPNGNTFCFDAARMTINEIYYISYVVGECNGTSLKFDDACLQIISKPVRFNPYPSANGGVDQDVCGFSTNFEASPSIGIGEWTTVSTPAGANAIYDKSLPASNITVDTYGRYVFAWTENNKSCEKTVEVVITFHGAPNWLNVEFECDNVAENYKIKFDINGGDQASWKTQDASGWIAINVGGNTYESPWIPWDDVIRMSLTDKYDCMPANLDTSFMCDCITKPGTIELAPSILCLDGNTTTIYSGGVEDPNDVVIYYLHDGDGNTIGTVIDKNATGIFGFDVTSMTLNTTYYVTVRVGNSDGFGGVKDDDRCNVQTTGIPVTWYDTPKPDIDASANVITCVVKSINLNGSVSVNKAGTGNLTFKWSSTNGRFESGADLTQGTVNVEGAGTYKLVVTNDFTGCSNEIEITIDSDKELITASAGSPKVLTCDVTVVELDGSASDQGSNFAIEWDGPGINSSNRNEAKPLVSEPGKYTILIRNEESGCDEIDTVNVTSDYTKPTPDAIQIGEVICANTEVELDGGASVSANGIRSYRWISNGGVIVGTGDKQKTMVDGAGNYSLIVIDDGTGCADTFDIVVEELPNTLESIEADVRDLNCGGDNSGKIEILSVEGGNGPFEYNFNNSGYSKSNTLSNLDAGNYSIKIRDKNGCEMDTMIAILQPDEVSVKANEDKFLTYGDDINIKNEWHDLTGFVHGDTDTDVYWEDEDGNVINPDLKDLKKSHYVFTVVAVDENGCESRDILNIYVKIVRDIYVPNVFAPKSDGSLPANQIFKIYGKAGIVESLTVFRVYDRWGEMVYSNDGVIQFDQNGASEKGWNGSFRGEDVNPGVYVYYVEVLYRDLGDGPVSKKYYGDITIVR